MNSALDAKRTAGRGAGNGFLDAVRTRINGHPCTTGGFVNCSQCMAGVHDQTSGRGGIEVQTVLLPFDEIVASRTQGRRNPNPCTGIVASRQ